MLHRILRPALTGMAVVSLVCLPVRATWSIVIMDRATGEVCVAAATCVNIKLQNTLPAIAPGIGVASAQSFTDPDGSNLKLIQDGLLNHWTPAEILAALAAVDPDHETRQYGIVSIAGPPVTFTGLQAGEAKPSVVGEVGNLVYAIQGNVLAGDAVVTVCEAALLGATGDLSQRVMVAMEAARMMGGDGRCSCNPSDPTACGAPPPSFLKTALSSFIVVARPGDQAGPCGPLGGQGGCTTGTYYMLVWDKGSGFFGDSVLLLQQKYDDWRATMVGVPDAFQSTVTVDPTALVADGRSRTTVRVELHDLDGSPLTQGGQKLSVRRVFPGYPPAVALPAHDLHDGTYEFDLQATSLPGRATFYIVVEDEATRVRLPEFSVYVKPPGGR